MVGARKEFGDNASGPANVSTEMMPSHKFPVLGVYNVELTISDDKNTKDIVVSKDIAVLTTPVLDIRTKILEKNSNVGAPRSYWYDHRLRTRILNTWNKVNTDQIDVYVSISGTPNNDYIPRDYVNNFDGEIILQSGSHGGRETFNQGGDIKVVITYKTKKTNIEKKQDFHRVWDIAGKGIAIE